MRRAPHARLAPACPRTPPCPTPLPRPPFPAAQRALCCAEATFHFKFNITSFKDIPGAPDVKQRFILFKNGVHYPGVYVETPAFKLVAKKDDRDKPARMAGVKLPGIKQALEKAEKGLTDACQYADDVHGYQEILRLVQTALQRLQRVAAQPGDAVPTKQNPFPDIPRNNEMFLNQRYASVPSGYGGLAARGGGGLGGGAGPSSCSSAAEPAAAALGGLEALMMAADSRTVGGTIVSEDPLCAQESLGTEEQMQTLLPGGGRGAEGGGANPLVKRQRTMDMADALLTTDEQLVRAAPPLCLFPLSPFPSASTPSSPAPSTLAHPRPLAPLLNLPSRAVPRRALPALSRAPSTSTRPTSCTRRATPSAAATRSASTRAAWPRAGRASSAAAGCASCGARSRTARGTRWSSSTSPRCTASARSRRAPPTSRCSRARSPAG